MRPYPVASGRMLLPPHVRPLPVSTPTHSPLVAEFLVLAEHEGDLARASADVTGGNVGVLANVALELGHEGDAEAADLAVGLALGVEVGAALAAAHGEAGEGILEGLLEAEELEDGEAAVGNKRCVATRCR